MEYEKFYHIILESVINIITQDRLYDKNVETIVTDNEIGLINPVKKFFPNSHHISFFFHYQQDIINNLRHYGLLKRENDIENEIIINKLSSLPIIYNGDMNIVYKSLDKIAKKYPLYANFIENYFKKYQIRFFENHSLNNQSVPIDCRTNNFLENYSDYIKKKLGEKRVINWINFLHFIKEESNRTITKLQENANFNKLYAYNKNLKISI